MRTQNISVDKPPRQVYLGRVGENEFASFVFDVSTWLAEYPSGVVSVTLRRPEEKSSYPVTVSTASGVVTWTPDATALAIAGKGMLELWITSGDVIGSSCIIEARIEPSLSPTGEKPAAPVPDWTLKVAENAVKAEKAEAAAESSVARYPYIGANKDWYVWDTATSAFVDTGILAVGTDGKSAYVSAVEGGYTGTEAVFYADLAAMSGLAADLEALL